MRAVRCTLEENEKSERFPKLHTETFQALRLPSFAQCWHSVSLTRLPALMTKSTFDTKAPIMLKPSVAISVALENSFLERIPWSTCGHPRKEELQKVWINYSETTLISDGTFGWSLRIKKGSFDCLSFCDSISLHANLCPMWSALECHRTYKLGSWCVFWVHHLLTLWFWASDLSFLCFSHFIFKMERVTEPTS